MATTEAHSEVKKLRCNGRSCVTCGNCCDWRFTGDAETWSWIGNYQNWGNDDWKRWRRNRMWTLFDRFDGATCTSVARVSSEIHRNPMFGGSTFDDPVFGGHQVVHKIRFAGDLTVNASHDFLFTGDQISPENTIASSTSDLCVCNTNNK